MTSMPQSPFSQAVVPPVIRWFKVYSGFMAALYGLIAIIMAVVLLAGGLSGDEDLAPMEKAIIFGILIVVFGGLFALFAFALFAPRVPWVWIYDLVLIAIGLTSCLTIPAALPLLLFWVKPEAKAYFGRV